MDQIFEMLCECLEQKRMLFEQYAAHTEEMASCSFDRLDYYITQRAQLAIEIDQIDAEILSLCNSDPEGEQLQEVVSNRGNFGDYSPAFQTVYQAAGKVAALINQVYQREPQVIARMQEERDRLLGKIREESDMPKVVKYVRGLASQPETGAYLGKKYDKV